MRSRFLPAKLLLVFTEGRGDCIVEASRRGGARGGTVFSGRALGEEDQAAGDGEAFCHRDVIMILMWDEAESVVASVLAGVAASARAPEGEAVLIDVAGTLSRSGGISVASEGEIMKSGDMMIVSITNHGEADALMRAARKVGARGGTVVNARGTGTEEDITYFGISLVPEKEILIIISDAAHADAIVEELAAQPVFSEPGGGIVFAAAVERFFPLKSR